MQQRRAAHCGSDSSRLAGLRVGPRALARPRPSSSSGSSAARVARHSRSARPLRVAAVQGGWSPQPLQPQQQPQQQPLQPQQPVRQSAPLARQQYAAAPVFLELSQVLNKQVVTRTSGRSLGSISGAWLDPSRGALVSFDLDERRSGPGGVAGRGLSTPARAGNIPLSALRQIGDVVLVHDEAGLYEPDLDGRLGFVNPVGLGVRTAAGEFLGKVRDLSFSPDSGAIARITYDEFGLPFLPISFFDCYSVALADVLSIGRADLIVYDDAKYRERKESAGLFAAIPSLLKSLNAPRLASPQLALPAPGGTSDMYRLGAGSAAAGGGGRYLPADYTYEQWQADLRRWEAETGMTYEQYLRSQPQQQQAAAPRTALPPGRTAPAQAGYAAAGAYGQGAYAAPQQQQQRPQQGYAQAPQQQQMQQPQQPQYGQAYGQQQMRPQQMPVQQQQQQPRYAAGQPAAGAAWGAAAAQQGPGAGQQFAAAGYNPVAAAAGAAGGAAAAGGTPGMAGLQQQRGQQQQQQAPRRSQVQPLQQQQQPQQTRAAGAAPVGTPRTAAPHAAAPQQPQQASSQQQQQQQVQVGVRVDEWMVRETRPRIADALADGVLPLTEEATSAAVAAEISAAAGSQAQQQPHEVL